MAMQEIRQVKRSTGSRVQQYALRRPVRLFVLFKIAEHCRESMPE